MTEAAVLMFGVTGRIGRRVARTLVGRGIAPRCVVRDPEAAAERLPDLDGDVDFVRGDLADPSSLLPVIGPGDRIFLMSPIDPRMRAWQQAVIERAGDRRPPVDRIVKLSGSTWTQDPARPTFSGTAHAQIEAALAGCGVPSVAVRPGVFTEGFLRTGLDRIGDGDSLALPMGEARVTFADLPAIASVCADLLLADRLPSAVVEVGFASPASGEEIAAHASAALGRPIRYRPVPPAVALAALRGRLAEFDLMHVGQMFDGIASGRAAAVATGAAGVAAAGPTLAAYVEAVLAGASEVT